MARKRKQPDGYVERFVDVLQSPAGTLLVRVGGLALLLLLGGLVVRHARAQAYQVERCRLGISTLTFQDLPTWADEGLAAELRRPQFYRDFALSIFDPDAEDRVRGTVMRHPMVRDVRKVEIGFPNSVTVTPVLRRPVARVRMRVRDANGRIVIHDRLLADDGSTLPEAPYRAAIRRRRQPLPRIRGISAHGPRGFGEVWADGEEQVAEAVAAALLAERIGQDSRGRVSISEIDVSRYPAANHQRHLGEILLRAELRDRRSGPRPRRVDIEWGRTERNIRGVAEEDSYRHKIGRLYRALERSRWVGPIDVRFHDGTE